MSVFVSLHTTPGACRTGIPDSILSVTKRNLSYQAGLEFLTVLLWMCSNQNSLSEIFLFEFYGAMVGGVKKTFLSFLSLLSLAISSI